MKKLSPLKAIRLKCLDCSGDSANEVKLCPCRDCELYPFRFGKNPYRKPISEELRQQRSERMKNLVLSNRPH
jgi:hypothetical protein